MYRKMLSKRKTLTWIALLVIVYSFIVVFHQGVVEYSENKTKPKSPPVVVYPVGGLGNQLFQYACAYSLARSRNSDLYICVYKLESLLKPFLWYPYSTKRRFYALDQLTIPQGKMISFHILTSENNPDCSLDYTLDGRQIENVQIGETEVMNGYLPPDKLLYVKDWFESEIFFQDYKEEIRELYNVNVDTSPIDSLLETIQDTQSVSVHIRRGDFRKKTDYRVISISYHKKAMKMLQTKLNSTAVHFFIFTDDLKYVKSQFSTSEFPNLIFVPELNLSDNSLLDFLLMLSCKHNIIANSTFSWWAAYLNKNPSKIVIAPLPKYSTEWINQSYSQNSYKRKLISDFAYPKHWITIEPEFSPNSDNKY